MEFQEEGVILKRVDEGKGIVLETKSNQQTKICDVCGYANEKEAALCKMCSNYLYGGVKDGGSRK